MKKSIIAGSVVAVLALGYIGASWYTGNVIQKQFDEKIVQLTEKINTNKALFNLDIQYSDYNKGIFSTSFHLEVVELNSKEILFNDDVMIYHGPFPWNNIKSADFSPKMAVVYAQLSQQTNKELWQAAGNKPFATINIDVDYSQNTQLVINNEQLNYRDQSDRLIWQITPNTLFASIDNNYHDISLESQIAQLQLYNIYGQVVTFNKMDYTGHFSSQDYINFQGTQNITLENIAIQDDIQSEQIVNLNQVSVTASSEKQSDNQAHKWSLTANKIMLGQQDLGQGEIESSYSIKDDEIGNKTLNIALEKLRLQNQQGNLDAAFKLSLMGDSLAFDQLYEGNVSLMEANANLPLQPLTYLVAQIAKPNQPTPDEKDLLSAQQSIMLISQLLLANYPFAQVNMYEQDDTQNGISIDLYYSSEEKQARLKGQQVTPEQFWHKLEKNRLPRF
ncbi:YdgA family protein [Orbus mooreae]|uniref:YdgA family protein n=1 Tax=Orbus mooreae TaxID=3074107 RepID=UPI00370DC1AD